MLMPPPTSYLHLTPGLPRPILTVSPLWLLTDIPMANSQSKHQVVVHSNPCECEPPHARPKEPPGLPGYPAAAEPGPDQTVPTPGCRLWFPAQVERWGAGGDHMLLCLLAGRG